MRVSCSGKSSIQEERQALRQQFTPKPVPDCPHCGGVLEHAYTFMEGDELWNCNVCRFSHSCYPSEREGDLRVIRLLDDLEAAEILLFEKENTK